MNYIKMFFLFFFGIILGYLIFSSGKSTKDLMMEDSSCEVQNAELSTLKKKLSSCERNAQFANSELNKLRENLSQGPEEFKRQDKNVMNYIPEPTRDEGKEFSTTIEERYERSSEDTNILSTDQTNDKNQPQKSEKWIQAEKQLDTLEKGDISSQSAFLKQVAITDFSNTLSSMRKVETNNQSFASMQGSYQGQMNDLLSKEVEYHLELELNFPPEGEGTYSARVEGRGLNLSTEGRGEAKGFSTIKDADSRAVFLKLNRDVYLQLYWNRRSDTIIGNAYRNLAKGFKKFGEFELVQSYSNRLPEKIGLTEEL